MRAHPRMKSLCLGLILSSCAFAAAEELGDIRIELMDGFASFTNRSHPDNRIGYRFHEHTPLSYGSVPAKNSDTKQPELTPARNGSRRVPARWPSTSVPPMPAGFRRTGIFIVPLNTALICCGS